MGIKVQMCFKKSDIKKYKYLFVIDGCSSISWYSTGNNLKCYLKGLKGVSLFPIKPGLTVVKL